MSGIILVASEELNKRVYIVDELRSLGYRVMEAESAARTLDILRKDKNILLAFIDSEMMDMDLLHLVTQARLINRDISLILLYNAQNATANKMDLLNQCWEKGVNYFLPYNLLDKHGFKLELKSLSATLVSYKMLENQISNENCKNQVKVFIPNSFDDIIAKSEAMSYCIAMAKRFASSTKPVLITGERGTGRAVFAHLMHDISKYKDGQFVTLYNAYNPLQQTPLEDFIESFKQKAKQAEGGTFVIENFDNMSKAEIKFLQEYLQEQDYNNSAAFRLMLISVSAIEALKKDRLVAPIINYLDVVNLRIPSLRRRRDDIAAIAQNMLWEFSVDLGMQEKISGITGAAISLLEQYDWPGNIVELQRLIYHALLISEGPLLKVKDFAKITGAELANNSSGGYNDDGINHSSYFGEDGHIKPLYQIEEEAIKLAVKRYKGGLSETARRLKVGRSTLYRKMESWQDEMGDEKI